MKRALLGLVGRSMLSGLAVGGLTLGAPGVAAANPACGSTVTHNVTLTADMSCPSSDGFHVGKAGVTIDLNHFTITGGSAGYGIYDGGGYDRVTVENGTIKNFSTGVYYYETTGARILHVKSLGASLHGIDVETSQNGTIEHATASGANGEYGFYLYENSYFKVNDSKATGDYYGVYDYQSLATLDKVVTNSDVYGLDINPVWIGADYYTIENSTANNNSDYGAYISNNDTAYNQAIVSDNTANDNGQYGFYAEVNTKGKGNHATGNGTLNCWHVRCG